VESQLGQGSTFILLLPAHGYEPEQSSRGQAIMAAGATAMPLSDRGERHV